MTDSSSVEEQTRKVITASKSRRELMRQVSDLDMADPIFDKDTAIQQVVDRQNIFNNDDAHNGNDNDNDNRSIASDRTARVEDGSGLDLVQFHQSLQVLETPTFAAAPKPLMPYETDKTDDIHRSADTDSSRRKSSSKHPYQSSSKQKASSSSPRKSTRSSTATKKASVTTSSSAANDLHASMQSLDLEQAFQKSDHTTSQLQYSDAKHKSKSSSIGLSGHSTLASASHQNSVNHNSRTSSLLNQSKSTIAKSGHSRTDRKSKSASNSKKKSASASSKSHRKKPTASPHHSSGETDQLIREAALAYEPSTPRDSELMMEALQSSHTDLGDFIPKHSSSMHNMNYIIHNTGASMLNHSNSTEGSLTDVQDSPQDMADSKPRAPEPTREVLTQKQRTLPALQNIFEATGVSDLNAPPAPLSIPDERSATIRALVSPQVKKKPSLQDLFPIVADNAALHDSANFSDRGERGEVIPSKPSNSKGNKLSNSFKAIAKRSNHPESARNSGPRSSPTISDPKSSPAVELSTPGRARRLLSSLNVSAHFDIRRSPSQSPARQRSESRSLSRSRSPSDSNDANEIASPLGPLKGLLGKMREDDHDDTQGRRRKSKGIFHRVDSPGKPVSSEASNSTQRPKKLPSPPQPEADPDMVSPTRLRRTFAALKPNAALLEL